MLFGGKNTATFQSDFSQIGIAFFKGRLNTERLTLMHRLIMWFAMFSLSEIENGDFSGPVAIGSWTNSLFIRMKDA